MRHKIHLCVVLIFFSATCLAEQRQSLFTGPVSHGGFGGPVLKLGSVASDSLVSIGGKGAWLVNHQYYLGGGAYGGLLSSDNTHLMSYSGPLIGFILNPFNTVHFSFELLFGGGEIADTGELSSDRVSIGDSIIVIEPSVFLSLNLSQVATLNFGVNYRYVSGSDTDNYQDDDLSGLSGEINILFGRF